MNKLWIDDGWADYLYWQSQDKNWQSQDKNWQSQDKNLAEELTKLTGLSMPLMKMGFYG
ncbi:hypothetical protein Lebu_1202 [Leptotrichia buccalis C-1013-b]|uniref:Uncharacterized protein n=1 Tax=Leptotrichia buccalis (strain ATCC 14201 / DSM 1135 / JCM 12969 / NCTC 10249 / C-1013-b) TaxID=523794 RepID=C7NAB2_LEPBD|nr:hypothetical protein Lebu_1202 [Leptotrichia buccalis C-1013-b]